MLNQCPVFLTMIASTVYFAKPCGEHTTGPSHTHLTQSWSLATSKPLWGSVLCWTRPHTRCAPLNYTTSCAHSTKSERVLAAARHGAQKIIEAVAGQQCRGRSYVQAVSSGQWHLYSLFARSQQDNVHQPPDCPYPYNHFKSATFPLWVFNRSGSRL